MSLDLATAPEAQLALIRDGYCGRPKRNPVDPRQPYCLQPAGARTDHLGDGACWLHGGRNKLRSGRYSAVKHTRLARMIAEHEEDPNPLDIRPEIAAVRGLIEDYINRFSTYRKALLTWYESYQPGQPHVNLIHHLDLVLAKQLYLTDGVAADDLSFKVVQKWLLANQTANPKPTQILDLADAVKMLSEATKMVERVTKQNLSQAISRKDFTRIMQEIGNIIDTSVKDDSTKQRIKDKIGSLRLA